MLFRLLFPYIVLLGIVVYYVYSRYRKLGPTLLKMDRKLLSRHNADSLILIIIIGAASYMLARYEIVSTLPAEDQLPLGPFAYIIFYGVLMLIVISREIERPALREKGISSSRGFWYWHEVESFRWSKNILTLNLSRGKRRRVEIWDVKPQAIKEIDLLLKKMAPGRGKGKKRKT